MGTERDGREVIGGNVYPKYATRNPIARAMMRGFLGCLDELVALTGARAVHEVGCGEGYLAERLARAGLRARGSDLSPDAVRAGRSRLNGTGLDVRLEVRDLYALAAPDDAAELIVACEVLEHVADPERALEVIASLARPHLIVSVPREPLWRALNVARGRYLRALGNTPGHVQHFSTRRFIELVGCYARIEEIRTPLPWTMLYCRASCTSR